MLQFPDWHRHGNMPKSCCKGLAASQRTCYTANVGSRHDLLLTRDVRRILRVAGSSSPFPEFLRNARSAMFKHERQLSTYIVNSQCITICHLLPN